MKKKDMYVSPHIEVIKMENEGVIAASGNLPPVGGGGSAISSTRGGSYNSAGSSDLEDLVNDILTVEQ